MKNISIVFFALCLSTACALLSSCNPTTKPAAPVAIVKEPATETVAGRIAYVNLDSLEANVEIWKAKQEEFKNKQEQMQNELEHSYLQMQNEAATLQKKADANQMTQSEGEAAQKHLMQLRQSLETRKQALTEQLVKQQETSNKDLKDRLNTFLEEYNKTRHYDYILSYASAGSPILYANKALDITKDVVAGINASAKKEASKAR